MAEIVLTIVFAAVITLIGACAYVTITCGQITRELNPTSASLDQFALNLLVRCTDQAGDSLNLAVSPYTVWSLLCVISEGALANTAEQLQTTLGIPTTEDGKIQFRNTYRSFAKNAMQSTEGVSLDISNAIFTTSKDTLNPNFEQIARDAYGVNVTPVNFEDRATAVKLINQQMAMATRNRIKNFVSKDDMDGAEILMTSALFFKGKWKVPFNRTATYRDTFYDERGNQKGEVEMMYQASTFPFSVILNNTALAVELAYGKGDKISMIVILPRRNQNLSNVLRRLADTPLITLLETMARAEQDYVDEDVQVHLPKFSITSDLNLNTVLDQMGIKDVFNLKDADLRGMFHEYFYLSAVIQKAMIEVDEEGTVAAAITGGSFAYKSPPPKFHANKPFAYLIVDKQTQGIIFAGKVSSPSRICPTCTGN